MSTARAVFGGLLSGIGGGMIAQAEDKRKAALERARQLYQSEERQEDRQWRREDAEIDRQWRREEAETSREHDKGLSAGVVTAADGTVYDRTRGGDVRDTGIIGETQTGVARAREQAKIDAKGGTLTDTQRNTMERIASNYWGKLNSEGQFIVPEEARDNYTETAARAEEMAARGVPPTRAVQIAAMSISGKIEEKDARRMAQAEAEEAHPGLFKSDEREKFIADRVPQLIEESSTAEKEYQRLVSGQDSGTAARASSGGSSTTGGLLNRAAETATKATALPMSGGRIDAGKLVEGQVYQTSRGLARYLGNGEFESAE